MRSINNLKHRLPVLAIDLGGTKIISAIVSPDGQLIAKERSLTLADEGQASVINRLLLAVDRLLKLKNIDSSQLDSISIAAAGGIDIKKGLVTSSPHLPGWHNVPLRDIVRDKYKVGTFLLNDASAAALGEHRFGAGRGVNNLVLLTIGTGIGGGIIIDGRLYHGPSGSAGEFGHTTIDVNGPKCACGNVGCLETLVSGTAMAREARRRIAQGESSSLVEMVAGKIEEITAEEIGAAARGGDSLALDIITEAATYLGVGLVNLVNIFNPEMIIIGGSVAKLGDLLLDPARRLVKERAFPISAQAVRIVTAQLGDEAGLLGAAVFALEQPR
ncbi:Protein mlc [subsurface metagenome]